jgi:hypothetical protein
LFSGRKVGTDGVGGADLHSGLVRVYRPGRWVFDDSPPLDIGQVPVLQIGECEAVRLRLHCLQIGLVRLGRGASSRRSPDVSVLLLEAGGDDDVPQVMRAEQWPLNLGSERDWTLRPNPTLTSTAAPFVTTWATVGRRIQHQCDDLGPRHKNDCDFFAAEAGHKAWSYGSALNIYRCRCRW